MTADISTIFKSMLVNEADVDHKVSFRLLVNPAPAGLGIPAPCIRCQSTLAAVEIDKGKAKNKKYKPEFIVFLLGLPVLVVEDKAPGEDIGNAIREAQLYAHELNKQFGSGNHPCQWCMATDGERIVVCRWDSGTPDLDCDIEKLVIGSAELDHLHKLIGEISLTRVAERIRSKTPKKRSQARWIASRGNNEDIPHNKFGAQIVADYRGIFEPEDMKDREFIAKHAYIKSAHREQHADEIDRVVASAFAISIPGSTPIRDTGRADEIVRALSRGRHLENQILLLVGRRGSGKTTFIDYLRVERLPVDIRDRTLWIHLNLNDAPKGSVDLQDWILREVVEQLEKSDKSTDFNSPKTTQNLFAREINELEKRVLFVLDEDSDIYKAKMAEALFQWHNDHLKRAKALKWYLAYQRQKLLVVVFDNCDKRDRDEQLNCFEVARYVQKELECLIVLPIRDVTYHLCKDEPPLDASANSLVYTIAAPRLSKIMARRIELILEQLRVNSKDPVLQVRLASGNTIDYPKNELGFFLTSLYQSLWSHDKLIRSIIVGLAGNDIRRAIKIFLEFVRSGLISEHYYALIKNTQGKYAIPSELVKQVLIRAGYTYFNEQESFLTNLFQAREGSGEDGNLLRIAILFTLDSLRLSKRRTHGTVFVPFSELLGNVASAGFEEQRALEEVNTLLERGLIIADHQRKEIVSGDDRLRVSPSAVVHLKLLSDLTYVGACAEDVFIDDDETVNQISYRLRRSNGIAQFYTPTLILNGGDLWDAIGTSLENLCSRLSSIHNGLLKDVAQKLQGKRTGWRRNRVRFERSKLPWDELHLYYNKNVFAKCVVVSVGTKGVRVKMPGKYSGWVPNTKIPSARLANISAGDLLECRVMSWKDDRKSFLLSCEEDG